MLEAYEGVVYFCIVYTFGVLLVLVLHALEGFIDLVLVGQVEDLVVGLADLALLQIGLSLHRRQKLLIVSLTRLLMHLLIFLPVRAIAIEEGILIKPINLPLIILRIQLILKIDLMFVLIVFLNPPLADNLLHRAGLLLKRN